MKLPTEFEQ